MSKMLCKQDESIEAYCIGNTARPLLCHGPKGVKGSKRTYLYVEAIRKFGLCLEEADLSEAYKRALPMYSGRLRRTFIVLGDRDERNPYSKNVSGANKEPLGAKRPGTDNGETNVKTKKYILSK
jgi:hypothetical protein